MLIISTTQYSKIPHKLDTYNGLITDLPVFWAPKFHILLPKRQKQQYIQIVKQKVNFNEDVNLTIIFITVFKMGLDPISFASESDSDSESEGDVGERYVIQDFGHDISESEEYEDSDESS